MPLAASLTNVLTAFGRLTRSLLRIHATVLTSLETNHYCSPCHGRRVGLGIVPTPCTQKNLDASSNTPETVKALASYTLINAKTARCQHKTLTFIGILNRSSFNGHDNAPLPDHLSPSTYDLDNVKAGIVRRWRKLPPRSSPTPKLPSKSRTIPECHVRSEAVNRPMI